MEKTILIGGKAGQGIAITSRFIGKVFCGLGYFVFNYRDYPSLIRGGHNFNVLRVSDKPIYSHKEKYDIIIALDQKTADLHEKKLNRKGFILGDKTLKAKKIHSFDISSILAKLKAPPIAANNIFVGWLFKRFGADKEILFKEAEKEFKAKSETIKRQIEEGYNLGEKKEELKKNGKENYFISGNEAIGLGAVAGGIDAYIAYPMTPATTVLTFLAKRQVKYNILALQLDDEIAAANAAVGASFAGARTMVGTSGGGFALMTEAISLAGISELPLIVYLAQRPGPATGAPTYTAQGDLKFALNAGHGEFTRIVVAPGDPQEAIARTEEAFYLTSKYRSVAIILADKHLGESDYSIGELKKSSLPIERFILENPTFDYKSYQFTKTGVSPRAVPGQGVVAKALSYEHTEEGYTTEDPKLIEKMTEKRLKKAAFIEKEINKLEPVKVYGKGKNLLIGWGSTKGAIVDALPGLKDFRFLQISYINPFPRDYVKKEIRKARKVILIENNVTGLLGDVIAEQTGIILQNKLLKYDGRPFTPGDIVKSLKKFKNKGFNI